MSPRDQALTALGTLLVAAGAWFIFETAPRVAVGPILGDLRLLIAAVAVLVFLAVVDWVLLRLVRRRHPP